MIMSVGVALIVRSALTVSHKPQSNDRLIYTFISDAMIDFESVMTSEKRGPL